MQTMVPAGADKIWAEDSGGAGPALLLLHEGVGDARMWDPIWPVVTTAYRAIRYDVRGFGRSPAATEDYTLLADALSVIEYFGVDAAHVVGCSMGGGTAIEVAVARPDLVKSLLLLCPGIPGYPYPKPDPAVAGQFDGAEAAGDIDGLIRLSLEQWGRAGDEPTVTDLMRSAIRAWDNQERFMQRSAVRDYAGRGGRPDSWRSLCRRDSAPTSTPSGERQRGDGTSTANSSWSPMSRRRRRAAASDERGIGRRAGHSRGSGSHGPGG